MLNILARTQWTPKIINTALWLDAADLSTITTVGSKVSEWKDKSGNGRNAIQTTDNLCPTLTNGNIVFSNSFLIIPNSDSTNYALKFPTSSFELFAVINPTSLPSVSIFFGARGFGNGWMAGSLASSAFMRLYYGSEIWQPAPMASGTMQTGSQLWNSTAPRGGTGQYRKNDNLVQETTSPVGAQDISNTAFCRIGCYESDLNTATGFFAGYINEIIILPYVTTESTRQKIAGYLAHKWGLSLSLPANHPYKEYPPRGT